MANQARVPLLRANKATASENATESRSGTARATPEP